MAKRSTQLIRETREWLEINCDDEPTWEDAYEEQLSNCGMMADGYCMYAGSEHCDWDCAISAMEDEEE